MPVHTSLRIAVIGAGPVGLALALHASRVLPHAELTLFDARALDADVGADPRTLALSLGSVQWLQSLGAWPDAAAAPIRAVHVSQAPPSFGDAAVRITADAEQVPMLGAVLRYGALVARLQAAWVADVGADPARCRLRFGTPVRALKPVPEGIELDAGIAEVFDLAVVAEGGIYADQPTRPVQRDYGQTAWVGTVTIDGGAPDVAYERFTRQGPAALLPLPVGEDGRQRAALVWCVPSDDDPVQPLTGAQRLAVLNTLFPAEAGRLVAATELKPYALGLNAERTLVDGRRVSIGNAAQTLHPVAGQGLNLGLRDAHQLVAALRFDSDVDAALRRVEWARAPDRWSMIAATDFLARSFTWPGLGPLRGLALAALQRAGPLKSLLARQMMFGWR
jgi:2-octaprenyl-6-methoxyphenol hydroxylase